MPAARDRPGTGICDYSEVSVSLGSHAGVRLGYDADVVQSTSHVREVSNKWQGSEPPRRGRRVVMCIQAARTAVLSVPAYGRNVFGAQEVVLMGTGWTKSAAWKYFAPTHMEIPLKGYPRGHGGGSEEAQADRPRRGGPSGALAVRPWRSVSRAPRPFDFEEDDILDARTLTAAQKYTLDAALDEIEVADLTSVQRTRRLGLLAAAAVAGSNLATDRVRAAVPDEPIPNVYGGRQPGRAPHQAQDLRSVSRIPRFREISNTWKRDRVNRMGFQEGTQS